MTIQPTISELYNDILSALRVEFNITLNPFGDAFLIAFSGVLAGVLKLIYLSIGLLQKNIWVDTCDYDTLVRFGVIILQRYPFPATMGLYTVSVTGTAGSVIEASTTFRADDTAINAGAIYLLVNAYTLTGTGDTIQLTGTLGGDNQRLFVGDTLTCTQPLIDIEPIVTVTGEDTTPVDAEDIEQYRAKVIEKIQLPAGSWNAIDYRLVGIGVVGVKQTYAYGIDPTTVNVWLQGTVDVAYPADSVSPSIIADYETALNLVRPLPAFTVNVDSAPINNIDITITSGTFTPFTTSQQATITAALTQFVNSVHPFIAAADSVASRNDVIATYNLSTVISQAVLGYGFSAVDFTVQGNPSVLWQADQGNIPFLNSVVYA